MTSCLILGGGINGLLSAFMLRQAGLEVRVLDQGATGMESSWAGAGILSLLLPWNYAPEVRESLHFPEHIRIHDVTLRAHESDPRSENSVRSCPAAMIKWPEKDSRSKT